MTTYYKQYETTFLSKLPEDLLDYIWSMNHEWAANIMQHAVRSFIRIKVQEIRKMIDFACWPCDFGAEMLEHQIFFNDGVEFFRCREFEGFVAFSLTVCQH